MGFYSYFAFKKGVFMKKILIAFLFSLSCVCALTATACKDNEESSSSNNPPPAEGAHSVLFTEGEGYTFETDVASGSVSHDDTISFTVDVSVFYTGYPVVYVNETAIAPDKDGVYSVTVTEDVVISLTGIQKAVSNMAGTGSMEDAFVVTSPIDLIYIAEQVNKGVEAYTKGAYVLANDIDCGGEELQVIGDFSTENSYFSGCFSCLTDSQTGEMNRYTISNFVIDTDDTNYVGLFGTVYADANVTSSGLFYGICLDNFTINATVLDGASADGNTVVAGGLIGYGVGANVYLCDATNGEINIYGDSSYFSFAGGLVGYQQGFYASYYDSYFPSEIVYSMADVDVRILSGTALYAGGITGYLSTDVAAGATAFIHNSYATGNVSGALRSGGIAGGLGQYTSVSNCYAIGDISAVAKQSPDFLTDAQYAQAYAGGIVGFAENDSIASDCFFDGSVSATSAYGSAYTDHAIAGGDAKGIVSATGAKYTVYNCITDVDLSSLSYFEEKLGWGDYDWVFSKENYPTINYETSEGTISAAITAHFVAPDGETILVGEDTFYYIEYFNTGMSSTNMYAPMGNYILNGLDYYFEATNGYLSFGYFFDEACTKPVPFAFVPQKTLDLYIGFADPTPIVGTYYIENEKGETLSIHLDNKGIVTYSDGATSQKTYYQYDGENLLIEDARLARYYMGEVIVDDSNSNVIQDPAFDMSRYGYYDFLGKVENGTLTLYDGVYFTAETPLVAKTEITSPVSPYDIYKGVWTKSATVNKFYTFDGLGNWTYSYKQYVRDGYSYVTNNVESASGAYTVQADGSLAFTHNGVSYTASFNSDGFLEILGNGKTQIFYAENSYVGTWTVNNVTFELFGITNKGYGKATVTYGDGYVYDLIYEASETDGYIVLYWADATYVKGNLFGYYTYNVALNTLYATIVDPESATTGYMQTNLYVTDDYNGEWVSNSPVFLHADFSFNGNGLYSFLYGYTDMEGVLTITIDNVSTEVTYTLESTQKGTFAYEGILYTMTYNEDDNTITLTASGETSSLERKDVLAGQEFIDANGNTYTFNGKSNLSIGGVLTVNETTTYVYKTAENGWTVYSGANEVGTLVLDKNHYDLMIDGVLAELYLTNQFMGEWAIGGAVELFVIGPTDLDGNVSATYKGYPVTLEQTSLTQLKFRYRENNMPYTYYVFVLQDSVLNSEVLVLSQSESLVGEYMICTKANALYGTWKSASGFTLKFDGVTSGAYSYGTAYLSKNTPSSTPYYYTFDEKGTLMWSQGLLGNKTYYYKLEMLDLANADLSSSNVFVQYDKDGNAVKAILRTKVDGLYLTEAKGENDTVYFFDGLGNLYVGDEIVYTYEITSYNSDNTTYLEVTDKNGVTYAAVLDYSDSSNITLTIGDIVTE